MNLLPCPFCGSIDVEHTERTISGHGDCSCEVYVKCRQCHAKGPDCGSWGTPSPEQRLEASRKWNERPELSK